MNGSAHEWVKKAEGDVMGAGLLLKNRSQKTSHLICFACQQCAEKYLKAFLVEKKTSFPKTYDLSGKLLSLCAAVDHEVLTLKSHLEVLDPYSIDVRYPGEPITRQDARDAFKCSKEGKAFHSG